jgi:alpha-tubulin suppressor-like RCC1 family protein
MWGANNYGTGNGFASYSNVGTTVSSPSTDLTWTNIAVGGGSYGSDDFSLFVKADGTLWGVGNANYGQFGGGNTFRSPISQIGTDTNWARVSCGYGHCMAIKTNGSLWGSGRSQVNGTQSGTSNWVQVGTDTNWSQVSCGADHTIALKTNGTMWATGFNYSGQLGLGYTSSSNFATFTQIGTGITWAKIIAGNNSSMGISTTGQTYMWGSGSSTPACGGISASINLITGLNLVDISLGTGHGLGITPTGTLRSWGDANSYGQQGIGNFNVWCTIGQVGTATNWLQVSAAHYSSFAINSNGDLIGWGLNNHPSYYQSGQYGYTDCYTQNYTNQLGFNNQFLYSYQQNYAYYSCYSGDCDWNYDLWQPICCDPNESPTYFTGTYTVNCYEGRYPFPVTIVSGTGNKFLALAQGYSSNHMAAIRTS